MKMNRRTLALLLLTLSACKTNGGMQESQSKYGHLDSILERYDHLIDVPPNVKIEICGYFADKIERAVREWAAAIDREEHLTFVRNDVCGPKAADTVARVSGYEPSPEQLSAFCKYAVAAATPFDGFDFRIGFCTTHKFSDDIWRKVLLHEVGHSWGMCDQYGEVGADGSANKIGMHPRCSPIFRSEKATASIMSATKEATTLTPDDTLGIRILACRNDQKRTRGWNANLEWTKVVGEKMRAWEGIQKETSRINTKAGEDLFLRECI
jgi:hypothetical protein